MYDQLPVPHPGWQAVLFIVGLSLSMTLLSCAIRFGRHFSSRPRDLVYLPLLMLINVFVLMPIRVLGFIWMGHNAGWGTRSNAFGGASGRNVQAAIPYLLGGAMLAGAVLVSVWHTRPTARQGSALWVTGNATVLAALTLWLVARVFVSSPAAGSGSGT